MASTVTTSSDFLASATIGVTTFQTRTMNVTLGSAQRIRTDCRSQRDLLIWHLFGRYKLAGTRLHLIASVQLIESAVFVANLVESIFNAENGSKNITMINLRTIDIRHWNTNSTADINWSKTKFKLLSKLS